MEERQEGRATIHVAPFKAPGAARGRGPRPAVRPPLGRGGATLIASIIGVAVRHEAAAAVLLDAGRRPGDGARKDGHPPAKPPLSDEALRRRPASRREAMAAPSLGVLEVASPTPSTGRAYRRRERAQNRRPPTPFPDGRSAPDQGSGHAIHGLRPWQAKVVTAQPRSVDPGAKRHRQGSRRDVAASPCVIRARPKVDALVEPPTRPSAIRPGDAFTAPPPTPARPMRTAAPEKGVAAPSATQERVTRQIRDRAGGPAVGPARLAALALSALA